MLRFIIRAVSSALLIWFLTSNYQKVMDTEFDDTEFEAYDSDEDDSDFAYDDYDTEYDWE